MARTIEQIKTQITANLQTTFTLSTSAVAEWRLWVHCFAHCIHMFELALDLFKTEMDADAEKEVAGTLTWYNDKCYEFQIGHELIFDDKTGFLRYVTNDPKAQVIKIASVNVQDNTIYFRVATKSENNDIVPLTDLQLLNFKNYVDAIKFAGTKSQIISTSADLVKYNLTVYYNPANPVAAVEQTVREALTEFKTSQKFGGIIYKHKMIEFVTAVKGVVAAKMESLAVKGTDSVDFVDVDVKAYLHSGYFNYTDDSVVTLISINDL